MPAKLRQIIRNNKVNTLIPNVFLHLLLRLAGVENGYHEAIRETLSAAWQMPVIMRKSSGNDEITS